MNFTRNSVSKKKKNQTSSKKYGRGYKPSLGPFIRKMYLSSESILPRYKEKVPRIIIAPAKCRCRDERGRTSAYRYCPSTEFDPEGWFCIMCGKGHTKSE